MRIDLHTHSRVSDGTDSPEELVRAAQAAGLDVLALTDHDTAEGWDEAAATAREIGLELVRGMEISTLHQGRSVHLLGYLPDATYPPLAEELQRILGGRQQRLPMMVERLRGLGVEITVEDVLAVSTDAAASGRPHVADALVRLGVVPDRDAAFDTLLSAGQPAYVGRYAPPLDQAIRLVADAGGVSVVAHVWGRSRTERPDEVELARLQEIGLTGIEVDHQDHSEDRRQRLRAIAGDLGLVVTGSSDYHGTGKTMHDLGINTTDPEEYGRLLEAAAAASAASSRETPEVIR
ncbi:PHP domain-containing protein [Nocardioides sp. CER19]|uniref:PHP domain-containing protein n=1 Tax=Nocardioides sp. CER19 TaxID=3038538 RepID=UPI00244AB9E4|nr:PHP domain-containing protein [Nocardioides sp. CER19]MDH2415159.1 PHP domain-containing protein [Nocardioides sp. CER19]